MALIEQEEAELEKAIQLSINLQKEQEQTQLLQKQKELLKKKESVKEQSMTSIVGLPSLPGIEDSLKSSKKEVVQGFEEMNLDDDHDKN
jgi:hypothetical protein